MDSIKDLRFSGLGTLLIALLEFLTAVAALLLYYNTSILAELAKDAPSYPTVVVAAVTVMITLIPFLLFALVVLLNADLSAVAMKRESQHAVHG